MRNILGVLMAALLVLAIVPAVFAGEELPPTSVETGFNIGVGITPANSCPEIVQEQCSDDENGRHWRGVNSVCYFVDTTTDGVFTPLEIGLLTGDYGRSYAFEGETIHFKVVVRDTDGVVEDCDKVAVSLDNGIDPLPAACTLVSTRNSGTEGVFECTYTVQDAETVLGTYWVSVQVNDRTCTAEGGCQKQAAGLISLYMNPAVKLTLSTEPGTTFGFMYNAVGDKLLASEIKAGSTVYSPYFTIENTADPTTGLYIGLGIYGKDMKAVGSIPAKCPDTNVLDIRNVEYKASHLNVQQAWTTMPRVIGYTGMPSLVFTGAPLGNLLGVGDDVTMRLRLNIPSPCQGQFDNGQIVFIGQAI